MSFVTIVGSSIDVNDLHQEKASSPINETDIGMLIDDNEIH